MSQTYRRRSSSQPARERSSRHNQIIPIVLDDLLTTHQLGGTVDCGGSSPEKPSLPEKPKNITDIKKILQFKNSSRVMEDEKYPDIMKQTSKKPKNFKERCFSSSIKY